MPTTEALAAARDKHPELHTRACDVGDAAQHEALAAWVIETAPALETLVHNAGIQRRVQLVEPEPWESTHAELAVNLEAPIHLTPLLLPRLLRQAQASIVNVTSGLFFVPLARVPIYCATKAAMQ